MLTKEFWVDVPGGSVYAKKWTPRGCLHNVPIVLLHDSLGCVDLWRDFPQQLSEGTSREVVAYDRLGFGRSSAREALPDLDFIWEEADSYFPVIKQAFSLDKYILYGYSVGGAMAVAIAAGDADCVALITSSAQAFVEDVTIAGVGEAKNAFQQPGQLARLEKWHGEKASWVLRAWTDLWLSPSFANWSLAPRIGDVKCPALVIHGDKDEYGSKAFPTFISKNTGGYSEMLILEDCGHMPHREKPREVLGSVTVFLTSFCKACE